MGRKLTTTVQVGPTVYEAGTDESDIKGEITAPGVWDNESSDDAESEPKATGKRAPKAQG